MPAAAIQELAASGYRKMSNLVLEGVQYQNSGRVQEPNVVNISSLSMSICNLNNVNFHAKYHS